MYFEIALKLDPVFVLSPVVLRFSPEVEAGVRGHPGDPGA